MYAVLCPMMYMLTQRFPKRLVLVMGLTFIGISMFIIGTSPYLGLHKSSTTIMIGLIVLGAASPMVAIPLIPEALEGVENRDLNYDIENDVNKITSAYFTTMGGIGETIGPISSSLLIKYFGFEESQEIFGTFILIFTASYFFFCGHFSICKYEEQ